MLQFIPNHKANYDPSYYVKHIEIPIFVFNLLRLCLDSRENLTLIQQHIGEFLKKYQKQNKDLMIGVFFYHFLIEHLPVVQTFKVLNIEKMLEYVLLTVQQDKNKNSFGAQTRHTVVGLFDLKDGFQLEHEYSYLALFKFLAATLLKTLVLTFKYQISQQDFKFLVSVFVKVA